MLPYWLEPSHIRYVAVHKIGGAFRRAIRGWAPSDTWSFDRYLAQMIAPALRHMAAHAHGYPSWILEEFPELTNKKGKVNDDDAVEAWQCWLQQKAVWFEWYEREDLGLRPGQTDEQKLKALDFYEKEHTHFKEVVLVDFAKRFDSLWD